MIEINLYYGEYDQRWNEIYKPELSVIKLPTLPRRGDFICHKDIDYTVKSVLFYTNDNCIQVFAGR